MFWIYVPPVILVAALAALVVMLGRKSADLKKVGAFRADSGVPMPRGNWKERTKTTGRAVLHLLEKILVCAKFFFKRTESVVSGWVMKLRARRNGKGPEEARADRDIFSEKSGLADADVKIVREIEKSEEIAVDLTDERRGYARSEVTARKRTTDEPAPGMKKEPIPEDKVKEAALIYRIAENPRDIEAYRELGDYYMGIENIKDAKDSFKMVLKLRPRDLKAKSSLREIEMKMRLGS